MSDINVWEITLRKLKLSSNKERVTINLWTKKFFLYLWLCYIIQISFSHLRFEWLLYNIRVIKYYFIIFFLFSYFHHVLHPQSDLPFREFWIYSSYLGWGIKRIKKMKKKKKPEIKSFPHECQWDLNLVDDIQLQVKLSYMLNFHQVSSSYCLVKCQVGMLISFNCYYFCRKIVGKKKQTK